MTDNISLTDRIPIGVLAIAPLVVLAGTLGLLYLTSPFGDLGTMTEASTFEIIWMLAVIGAIAGIAPVVIGMLWFPFIRSIDYQYTQWFLAASAGVLAFIGFEMAGEIVELGMQADNSRVVGVLAVVGIAASFAVMSVIGKWQKRVLYDADRSGLVVAYLIAVALGLHSLGEGLAIGTAFAVNESTLLMLLVIGFVLHNIMEGPTVVAAVAADQTTPPLRHFAAMGLIVGFPCIVGGWIGGFTSSVVIAALFFAVALGAIFPALLEVADLIKAESRGVVTHSNVAMFATGLMMMFLLENVLVPGLMLP